MNPVVVFSSKLVNPNFTGPTTARVAGLDPVTGRVSIILDGKRGILQRNQILSANVDAWNAGLKWAPKYWRTGINNRMQDWGDVPANLRASEEQDNDGIEDIPETLSLADFPGTPGPEHGRR